MEKKSKQKSIKILMPLGIDFGEDFGGFGVPKWSHVGPQMEPKMDLMLKPPKSQKILKNQYNFNDFWGSRGPSWEPKSTKNRSKKEVILGRHLGIDFSWILVDFGGQDGAKLGSKIDKKSIQKGIEKQIPKKRRLGGVLKASCDVLRAS